MNIRSGTPTKEQIAQYRDRGFIKVADFLREDDAKELSRSIPTLTERGLWYQAVRGSPWTDGSEAESTLTYRYEKYPIANHPLREMIGVRGDARRHNYDGAAEHPLQPERELEDGHPLRRFGRFLRSDRFCKYVEHMTGHCLERGSADCFLSRYLPGDYNGAHRDAVGNRAVAFNFYLTSSTVLHWGGQTVLFDETGQRVIEMLAPGFNRLLLFDVPRWHAVLPVSQYSREPRYALTGWFYSPGGGTTNEAP